MKIKKINRSIVIFLFYSMIFFRQFVSFLFKEFIRSDQWTISQLSFNNIQKVRESSVDCLYVEDIFVLSKSNVRYAGDYFQIHYLVRCRCYLSKFWRFCFNWLFEFRSDTKQMINILFKYKKTIGSWLLNDLIKWWSLP